MMFRNLEDGRVESGWSSQGKGKDGRQERR